MDIESRLEALLNSNITCEALTDLVREYDYVALGCNDMHDSKAFLDASGCVNILRKKIVRANGNPLLTGKIMIQTRHFLDDLYQIVINNPNHYKKCYHETITNSSL